MKIQIKTKRLHYFDAIILVMLFSAADCEGAMNNIKTDSRNKLGDILNELMLLYDMTPRYKDSIDIKKLAEKIAGKWSFSRIDKIPWIEAYGMCIV